MRVLRHSYGGKTWNLTQAKTGWRMDLAYTHTQTHLHLHLQIAVYLPELPGK